MSHCLRDQTLLLLYEGEEAGDARSHLNTCVACHARYQHLVSDLEVIDETLQGPPLWEPAPRKMRVMQARRLSVAVACVLVMIVVGGRLWWQESSVPVSSPAPRAEEIVRFVEKEVAPALFATTDGHAPTLFSSISHLAYVEAAVQGEWPCERQTPFADPRCEVHPFPLLIGGQ